MNKYQGRVDPLELLRNAYSHQGKKPKLKDSYLIFEKDIRLSLHQPTAWLSPHSKKQYTIGSLWLFLEHHQKRISDYMGKVSEYGVDNVTVSDRNQIANYFESKISESNCINQELKLELAMKSNTNKRDQPTVGFEGQGDLTKKVKSQILPFQLQVIEFIYKFERPTSSKTRSLRCPHKSFESLLKVVQTNPTGQGNKSEEKKMRINAILQRKKYPIIIVPEHPQAGNVNLGNIERFLVHGEYIENAHLTNPHQRKIQMQYTLRGRRVMFDVTNNPSLLSLSDWDNVVAVFVQGRKNEFQTWTVSNPADIFKKAKGYSLKFPTKETSQAVQWNIKIFILEKNVRYRDCEVQKAIWADLESFLYEKI